MTRRAFLSMLAGLALSPAALAVAQESAGSGADLSAGDASASDRPAAGGLTGDASAFEVIVATDLHYIARELTDNGEYFTKMTENGDGKVMLYSEELVSAFVEHVIERKPHALILSGDLSFNGERVSHERLAEKLSRVADAGVAVHVIPGNHDLNMRIAARFEGDGYTIIPSVNAQEFREIYGKFGYDNALSLDVHSLSYVSRLAPGLRLLMLDVNGVPTMNTVPKGTLDWVSAQMGEAQRRGERVISVSHQNLRRHNAMIYRGFVIDNADALLLLLGDSALHLSGHIHMQHIARGEYGPADIATSSLAVSPNQFGVLSVGRDAIEYRTQPLDVSAWAAKEDLTDPNLLDFSAYSARFFRRLALRQSQGSAGQDEETRRRAEFMADINAAYFAGRMDTVDLQGEQAKDFSAQSTFFSQYIASLLAEGQHDMTRLRIDL